VLNIQSLCGKHGISVPLLEKELGFGKGSVYKWDKNSPSIDKLQKVAEYFNVSIDSLISGEINLSIDLSSQSKETQLEIAKIIMTEPSIEEVIKKLNSLPPEKREVILNLIKTM
jgi:transcriptional regulator with XRE-family HTH domain